MSTGLWATCPSCKRSGDFIHLGDQEWPAELAASLGLPARIPLWCCPNCHTTMSDSTLRPGVLCADNAKEEGERRPVTGKLGTGKLNPATAT